MDRAPPRHDAITFCKYESALPRNASPSGIEDRNNALETQTRNCGALLNTLDSLLSQLALGPGTEAILLHRPLGLSR